VAVLPGLGWDPCPCGSGKKYERCCGGATVDASIGQSSSAGGPSSRRRTGRQKIDGGERGTAVVNG